MADGALLLLGVTGFLGRRILRERAQAGLPVFLLAQPEELPRAHAAVARVTRRHPAARRNVLLFAGDVLEPGLGVTGAIADRILTETRTVVHALRFEPGPGRSAAAASGDTVRAVESLLAFAHRARGLEALVHVGSTDLMGDYPGTFYEDWFDVGQGFLDPLDRAVFEAESRVRGARRTLPVLIARTGLLLGDSETGEVDPRGGLAHLVRWFRRLRHWPAFLPLPGPEGQSRIVPVSPVDFVARAVLALAGAPDVRGQTFCLADPRSPTVGGLTDLVADASGAPRPTWLPDARWQSRLLDLPGVLPSLARAVAAVGLPAGTLRYLRGRNRHDTARAEAALKLLGVECPPFAAYARRLVDRHIERSAA
jgi:nucleoside-diphosphate-sugar epimerase